MDAVFTYTADTIFLELRSERGVHPRTVRAEFVDTLGSTILEEAEKSNSVSCFVVPQGFSILLGYILVDDGASQHVIEHPMKFHEDQVSNRPFIRKWLDPSRPEFKTPYLRLHLCRQLANIVSYGSKTFDKVVAEGDMEELRNL